MKSLIIAIASLVIATNVNAQVKERVEKAMNDPQRKEKEAKADAMLIDKTRIYHTDSSKINTANGQRMKKDCTRFEKTGKKKASKT